MNKKFIHVFCAVLVFLMVLSLFPAIALPTFAKAPRAAALDCTALNKDEDSVEQGWSWKYETKELTLSGLSISCTAETALKVPDGTTIIVTGINSVKSVNKGTTEDSHSFGLRCYGNLTIKGDGSLTTTGSEAHTNYGISCEGTGSLTICDNVKITAVGSDALDTSTGIYCRGPLTVSDNATVETVGGKASVSSRGVYAEGLITVTSGNFKARSSYAYGRTGVSYGMYAGKGITVYDGSFVAASDTQNHGGIGLYVFSGSAKIDGGDVLVRGGLKAFHKKPEFDAYSPERVTYVCNDITGKGALAWNNYTDITSYKYVRLCPYSPKGGLTCSDWAKSEIIRASVQGIIPDCLNAKDLREDITRQEFAAVAVRAFEILSKSKAIAVAENPFRDCEDSEVLKAYSLGITTGTSETTFEPDIPLNREMAATMLTRAYMIAKNVPELRFSMPVRFADDQNISSWAYDSVYFMATKSIIKGGANNMFMPRALTVDEKAAGYGNTTREQALLIALRMVEVFA